MSPLMDDKFEWPTLQEIRDTQKTTEQPDLVPWCSELECLVFGDKHRTVVVCFSASVW